MRKRKKYTKRFNIYGNRLTIYKMVKATKATHILVVPLGLHQAAPLASNRDKGLLFAGRINLGINQS